MTDHANDDTDLVELRALKITFKHTEDIDDDEMSPERRHFVTSEIGQGRAEEDDDDDASVLVTFDSYISGDTVIRRLKEVIRCIKEHGLPQTTLLVQRKTAKNFKQLEKEEPDLAEECFLYLEHFLPNKASDQG